MCAAERFPSVRRPPRKMRWRPLTDSASEGGADGPADRRPRPIVWFDRLVRGLALLAGVVLVLLVLLTVADVVMRYAFNAPIFGAQDMSQLALIVVVFLSMAYCGRKGGHVAVDLFVQALGRRAAAWIDAAVSLAGAGVLFTLAWRSVVSGGRASLFGSASNLLVIPFEPFYYVIALGAALYGLVLVGQAVAALAPGGGR